MSGWGKFRGLGWPGKQKTGSFEPVLEDVRLKMGVAEESLSKQAALGFYLLGLGAFALVNFLKLDLIAFIQIAIPVAVNGGIMDKNLAPTIFGFNETIPFHPAKPFDRSTFLRHDVTSTTMCYRYKKRSSSAAAGF